MAHVFKYNGKTVMKFHAPVKNFKCHKRVKWNGYVVELHINKNDAVHYCQFCKVLTWKTVEKNHKKFNIPDKVEHTFNSELYYTIVGNPSKIAEEKVKTFIERMEY